MVHGFFADATFDLIAFVFVAIIWGIGALASAMKKSAQARPPAGPMPPQAQAAPRPAAVPIPPVRKEKARAPRKAAAPALPAGRQAKPVPPPLRRSVSSSVTQPQATKGPAAAPAPTSSFARLLQPDTIRAQYILAEVLGKPLAMKDEPGIAIGPRAGQVRNGRSG